MTSGSEDIATTTGTIKVGLEYPAGTFTLANECIANGNAAIAFPLGNTSLTFNITIPKGAQFYLRPLVNCPTTGIICTAYNGGSSYTYAPGDFSDLTSTNPGDITMGGSFTASNPQGINLWPIAIVAQTRKPSVLIIGTSRETGGAEANYLQQFTYDWGITSRAVGKSFAYTNAGMSATTLTGFNGGTHTYLNQLIAAGYWSHISNEHAVNDLPTDTPATFAARRTLFASNMKTLMPSVIIIGHTCYPNTTSSDGWVTKTNQGATTTGARALQFNNLVRAGISGEDFFWDTADGLDPFRTGQFPVSRNPNDASRTPASYTAGLSGTTLTVSAIATGTINVGDPVVATGVSPSTSILAQLTGTTGSTGTYQVNNPHSGFPYNNAVAGGTAFTSSEFATMDGLHTEWFDQEMIQRSGVLRLDYLQR
jgi:hypothetical protein